MTEFLAVSGGNLKTCCKFQLSDRKVNTPERVGRVMDNILDQIFCLITKQLKKKEI